VTKLSAAVLAPPQKTDLFVPSLAFPAVGFAPEKVTPFTVVVPLAAPLSAQVRVPAVQMSESSLIGLDAPKKAVAASAGIHAIHTHAVVQAMARRDLLPNPLMDRPPSIS